MERTLSPDEKIKRAEEIYYRKKIQALGNKSARVNVASNKNNTILKKMILQIAICVVIYVIVYMIQNTKYIFSDEVLSKINEILSYDINVNNLYEQGKQYFEGLVNNQNQDIVKDDENIQEENNDINSDIQENAETESNAEKQENLNEETQAIGGENVEENAISEMEQDAIDISKNVSLVVPLTGTITSRFGPRESNNPIVSKYHTGIDIAVNEGTPFTAAMSGKVQTVSTVGEYRKSYRSSIWRCNDSLCTLL